LTNELFKLSISPPPLPPSIASTEPNLRMRIRNLQKIFDNSETNLTNLHQLIESLQDEYPSMKHIIENIFAGITSTRNHRTGESLLGDYTTAFKPGFITNHLLKQKTIILKYFAHPPVSVMERLNEVFAIELEFTLNEDYTNSLVPASQPCISFKNS
jgi:hypothetical protein